VLRKIFDPQRDEITGEWRRLRKKELYDVCASPNIIRVIEKNGVIGASGPCEGEERCIQNFGGET
jgi:hypothetical protein